MAQVLFYGLAAACGARGACKLPEKQFHGVVVKKVLNVGGNNKAIALPPVFAGWDHVLLDIDPAGKPDVVCDARELTQLPAAGYEAVYCSHNLEHYHRHHVGKVLSGFRHVLTPGGFAFIRVPDMGEVMQIVVERELDIDDVLYHAPAGPILVRDVIYGYGVEIERSGNDFFAHKTGFTAKSLTKVLTEAGFGHVFIAQNALEICAYAMTQQPDDATQKLLGISYV